MTTELQTIEEQQFREDLAGILSGSEPIAITRAGQVLGYFVPAVTNPPDRERITSFIRGSTELSMLLARFGVSEEDILADFSMKRRETPQSE